MVKKLSDNGDNIKSSDSSASFDDEFLNIYNTVQDSVIISIAYSNEELLDTIPKLAILSKQQKPNYHWFVFQLAIIHPYTLTIRQHDFKSDNEIDEFFDSIFTIPRKNYRVRVFDDYCNFRHNKFRFLKQNKIKVYYYTSRKNNNKFNEMKQVFSSFEMYIKKDKENAHEREISFEGFIINPTHDFWCLEVVGSQPKWSIHIQYNQSEYNKTINYISNKYERILR